MARRRSVDSFQCAVDGIVHTLKTQRHMRFHFLTVVLVLGVGALYGLDHYEVLILLFTISLVLIAEMFNTALEAIVDLTTEVYHPLAKFAKDIAAGAVLITAINALVVGFVLFFDERRIAALVSRSHGGAGLDRQHLLLAGVMGLVLMITLLAVWKVRGGKGTLLSGGVVSGHSAIGFFFSTLIIYMDNNAFVAVLAIALAILIAQSRVEAGIHTTQEVIIGALLGMLTPFLIYTALPALVGFAPHLPRVVH